MTPTLPDAARRARALARLHALDDLPPQAFARLARVAAHIAGDGVSAAVHLLDDRWQHRVGAVGVPRQRDAVETSLCRVVVEQDGPMYLPDPPADERFAGGPWTTGDAPLRMYFGAPVRVAGAGAVGTLCVFSTSERPLDDAQRRRIADLADEVATRLELLALTRELGHDAAHDPLTGVANRVLLSHRLAAALARQARGHGAPVLLAVDLDRFKAVNDTHGHGVGDEVLVSTAARLTGAVRREDVVARVGGDEFAVLLEEVRDDALAVVVARLRAAAGEPHSTSSGEVVCGFSVGVARARPGDLPYELHGRADEDLYAGKDGQRPRVPKRRTQSSRVRPSTENCHT